MSEHVQQFLSFGHVLRSLFFSKHATCTEMELYDASRRTHQHSGVRLPDAGVVHNF
jgi:hypothetical protein